MAAGALGLSTGLEYDPGIYSSRAEVVELAAVAARHGGRYISHMRSEDRQFWEAIDEILAIGREAKIPVQISHIKLAMRSLWGQAPRLLARLDERAAEGIDVTADIYPYLYWHSTLTVLFPERDFENLADGRSSCSTRSRRRRGCCSAATCRSPPTPARRSPKSRRIAAKPPARDAGRAHPARRGDGDDRAPRDVESVIGTSMTEADLEQLLAWQHTNLCTDGELDGRHPRGFGAYPRVLGRYVRERKVLVARGGGAQDDLARGRPRRPARPRPARARRLRRSRAVRPGDGDRSRDDERAARPRRPASSASG